MVSSEIEEVVGDERPFTHSIAVSLPLYLRSSIDIEVDGQILTLSTGQGSHATFSWNLPAPLVNEDTGVHAKYSKKKEQLTIKLALITSKPSPPSFSLPNPPRPKKMSAVSFAQDTLPPAIFEDLIEALQDWRLSKSEHDCLHVAKLIVSGCKKASRETSISALGSAFEAFLRPPPSFRSFIDGSAPIPTPLVPTPFSAKTEIVDDAAQKVLEYVVEHGTLPPDPDSPDPDTLRPLSTVTPSFLPPDTFITLCKAVKSHPALFSTSSSSLGEGFANTEGFIFRFSKAGIPKLRCHIWAEPLLPFFDASLDSSSNAFVLNVLNCLPTSKPAGYAVDWHRDATLALRPEAAMVNIKVRSDEERRDELTK